MLKLFAQLNMEQTAQENPGYYCNLTGKVPHSLLELSSDLKAIIERPIFHDLKLNIGERSIFCHRAILSTRSKWFRCRIDVTTSEPVTSIEMNENGQILNAVLIYLYTGNLCLIDDLKVPLLQLHEAAAEYGIHRLKNILTKTITFIKMPGLTLNKSFMWTIDIANFRTVKSLGHSKLNLSLAGTDMWYVRVGLLHTSQSSDVKVYMKRCTSFGKETHVLKFETYILDSAGRKIHSFFGVNIYKEDCEKNISEYISLSKMLKNRFISNDALLVKFILTISAENVASPTIFEIKREIEKDVVQEFHVLSYDMYRLLRKETFSDLNILPETPMCLKVHSSIVCARSGIPISLYDKIAALGSFGNIVWKSFMYYLYTGQERYLDDHMHDIYYVACKYHLYETKIMYSKILANNLTEYNVDDILSDAKAFGDSDLEYSAMRFKAKFSVT